MSKVSKKGITTILICIVLAISVISFFNQNKKVNVQAKQITESNLNSKFYYHTVSKWAGTVVPYHIYILGENSSKLLDDKSNIMKNSVGSTVEINHILFEVLDNYDLKVVDVPRKPAREIITDYNMSKNWQNQGIDRKVGDIVDFDVIHYDVETEQDKHDYMDSHGMAPGDEVQMELYTYKVLDNYQLEVVEVIGVEYDEILTDLPVIECPFPSEQGELPYEGKYIFKESVNTNKYFIKNNDVVQFNISPMLNDEQPEQHLQIIIHSLYNDEILNSIDLDITERSVYSFIFRENTPFYIQIKNKNINIDNSLIGSYSIQ